jgi:hypothetical protein
MKKIIYKIEMYIMVAGFSIMGHNSYATDYFVSSKGNDGNNGTSIAKAWATINKINGESFREGDKILFEGGKTFNGTLQFGSDDRGVNGNSLIISSYGSQRANINGGNGNGITLDSCQYLTIKNINLFGQGRTIGKTNAMGIYVKNCKNIVIDSIDAQGFQQSGIGFQGCSKLHITNAYVHDNGFAGISSSGRHSSNIYIGYCRANENPGNPNILNNHSGNGIVLYEVSYALIEYCEAGHNGWDQPGLHNGPVGIWCATNSDHVIIQYCISYNNQSNSSSTDGGGFGLDGGVSNSVIQYCLAYNNWGPGAYGCEYGSKWQWENNTIRYNILYNNARSTINGKPNLDETDINFGYDPKTTGGIQPRNMYVYNNIIYNKDRFAIQVYGSPCLNAIVANNIFITMRDRMVRGDFTFKGNCYWAIDGGFSAFGYKSLEEWANSTDQEKVDGKIVGINVDPKIADLSSVILPTDPRQLPSLYAFMLGKGSPCIDKGLDIKKLFNIDPGKLDFYGDSIPSGKAFDIGIHEAKK